MYDIFENLLKEKGVTAYRVAKETGITTTTLTQWKQGVCTPKHDKLEKIADYFGVTVDYLIGREIDLDDTFLELAKENLVAVVNEYPNESIRIMARMCKKRRIERDLTEKVTATETGVELDSYLDFEEDFVNIGIDNIVSVLLYFDLDISYMAGFLTGALIIAKSSKDEAEETLERLNVEEGLKKEVLKIIINKK